MNTRQLPPTSLELQARVEDLAMTVRILLGAVELIANRLLELERK
jgi:hypothetical protein